MDKVFSEQADVGRYNRLVNLVRRAVEGELDLYLEVCSTPPSEEYRPIAELAEGRGYSVNYLGLLARRGEIGAVKRRRPLVHYEGSDRTLQARSGSRSP